MSSKKPGAKKPAAAKKSTAKKPARSSTPAKKSTAKKPARSSTPAKKSAAVNLPEGSNGAAPRELGFAGAVIDPQTGRHVTPDELTQGPDSPALPAPQPAE